MKRYDLRCGTTFLYPDRTIIMLFCMMRTVNVGMSCNNDRIAVAFDQSITWDLGNSDNNRREKLFWGGIWQCMNYIIDVSVYCGHDGGVVEDSMLGTLVRFLIPYQFVLVLVTAKVQYDSSCFPCSEFWALTALQSTWNKFEVHIDHYFELLL